jgi:hypothetical protein
MQCAARNRNDCPREKTRDPLTVWLSISATRLFHRQKPAVHRFFACAYLFGIDRHCPLKDLCAVKT